MPSRHSTTDDLRRHYQPPGRALRRATVEDDDAFEQPSTARTRRSAVRPAQQPPWLMIGIGLLGIGALAGVVLAMRDGKSIPPPAAAVADARPIVQVVPTPPPAEAKPVAPVDVTQPAPVEPPVVKKPAPTPPAARPVVFDPADTAWSTRWYGVSISRTFADQREAALIMRAEQTAIVQSDLAAGFAAQYAPKGLQRKERWVANDQGESDIFQPLVCTLTTISTLQTTLDRWKQEAIGDPPDTTREIAQLHYTARVSHHATLSTAEQAKLLATPWLAELARAGQPPQLADLDNVDVVVLRLESTRGWSDGGCRSNHIVERAVIFDADGKLLRVLGDGVTLKTHAYGPTTR